MKYALLGVLALWVLRGPVKAQDSSTAIAPPGLRIAFRNAFIQKLDSLFVQEQYAAIVAECKKEQPDYNRKAADFNQIAACYFMGEKEKAFALLDHSMRTCPNTFAILDILTGDYTGYRQLLAVPEVKAHLMTGIYQKLDEETLSEKEHARALLACIIADQWNRYMSSGATMRLSKTRFPYPYLEDRSITQSKSKQISTDVFEWYQETGKLFSKAEVGSLYPYQLLLLFHEPDLSRRAYYLELLQAAVQQDIFPLVQEINSRIATELAATGDISSLPSPELVERYRKEYDMPDYQYAFF